MIVFFISGETNSLPQEAIERQRRVNSRSELIKKLQQEDLERRKELPIPLTELEKQQIAEKKNKFASTNEALEISNRALNSVKQIMKELKVLPKASTKKDTSKLFRSCSSSYFSV